MTIEFALIYLLNAKEHQEIERHIDAALTAGRLDVPMDKVLPLEECWRAHETVEAGGRSGSVVLAIP